ncbi:MAG: PTS transporter subunit EIIC [Lachnospiraceae bacterium]|nr:PTS transporter subunit EIIC [Lachnospiraceae bacterium]
MNWEEISKELLSLLGGKENVKSNMACMTRLRVSVKDMSKVDVDAIKEVEGVMGVVTSDTIQIVFGPGKVNKVLDAFSKLTGLRGEVTDEDVDDVARENKAAQKAKYDKPVQNFLKRIANIFVPLLPGIIAAGLINGLINVINVSSGGALSGVWWYECIHTMGWALFAYLPIFAGYNAAREFGGSPILGGIAGAMCIANAAMPLLAGYGEKAVQIKLPMTGAVYNPAGGGLIAALIAGVFFAFLEKKIRKVMPSLIDTFISPLLVLIIGSLAVVIVIQPLGAVLTKGIYSVMDFAYVKMGFVGGYILSAGFLPLVAVGLHQALTPIHAMLNDPAGPTNGINYLLPILMMAGGGQVGAGLALYMKTKNKKLKRFIRDSIPVGILGVGEPLMYAVTLPLGKAFITACLGAGFGGVVASLCHVGTVSQGVSGLFGLLIVEPGHQLQYVLAMLCAYLGGFVLTWFFGVDENRINDIYGENK